jgi:hypothetical protein
MKKHLLFLPDIFLVMLILFSCERIDLSEWRKPTEEPLSHMHENLPSFQEIDVIHSQAVHGVDVWKDYLADYKEKAKSIFSQLRVKIGENDF